jgi:hypothetical protein
VIDKGVYIEECKGVGFVFGAMHKEGARTGVTMVTKLVNSSMVGANIMTDGLSVFVGPVGGTPTFTLATPHEELAILGLLPLGNSIGF